MVSFCNTGFLWGICFYYLICSPPTKKLNIPSYHIFPRQINLLEINERKEQRMKGTFPQVWIFSAEGSAALQGHRGSSHFWFSFPRSCRPPWAVIGIQVLNCCTVSCFASILWTQCSLSLRNWIYILRKIALWQLKDLDLNTEQLLCPLGCMSGCQLFCVCPRNFGLTLSPCGMFRTTNCVLYARLPDLKNFNSCYLYFPSAFIL